jgi:hypothetical protein
MEDCSILVIISLKNELFVVYYLVKLMVKEIKETLRIITKDNMEKEYNS